MEFGNLSLKSFDDSLTLMEAKIRFGGGLTVIGSEISGFSSLDNTIGGFTNFIPFSISIRGLTSRSFALSGAPSVLR